ncbi:hypothetical protein [Methylobacterium nodulans]|uniref:Uncharacterized protein n=1 Tax=Methylobacterium nodulans (strain LMG 21967 / CNCM I-2342 / ORS 2060) TaxID=460265 RepID=B8IXB7_METNO|nr:hypothetical protein [Methylobacterium nodulans]ACL63158.1 conserved hypothetical protein [Methylobacterium nodulans ORS 2060]
MADPGVSFDSWPAIVVGITAALAGALVPLNGFIKTLLDYRLEAKKAEALQAETARDVASASGPTVLDSIAIADLTDAVKELALAIREDTASDTARHNDQLISVLERLTDRLGDLEQGGRGPHQGQHRGSRRDQHHR